MKFEVHHYHHHSGGDPVGTQENLFYLARDVSLMRKQLEAIMATLNDVQTAVTAEDTVIDSAVALIQGLAAQIAALQPTQAAIDALANDVKAKTVALSAAVLAGTPTPVVTSPPVTPPAATAAATAAV